MLADHLLKTKKKIQNSKITGDTNYIYKNELDKASFQHDMAYGDFKYLAKGTASDKVLKDKVFKIAKNPKYDGCLWGLVSMVYKSFDKNTSGSGVNMNAGNDKLAEELHKPIIRKFLKRTIYSRFKDNIWDADLADIQLTNKFNKGFRFSLCVIDVFSKYAFVIPLKDKNGVSIANVFQNILKESSRKPNKIWVDKGSKFHNSSFEKWLKDNDIEMCSINNDGKSVVTERFFRTLKTKIYKYMTSISKNVYIDKLDDIVN